MDVQRYFSDSDTAPIDRTAELTRCTQHQAGLPDNFRTRTGFGDHKLPIDSPLSENEQIFDLWLAFEFSSSAFQEKKELWYFSDGLVYMFSGIEPLNLEVDNVSVELAIRELRPKRGFIPANCSRFGGIDYIPIDEKEGNSKRMSNAFHYAHQLCWAAAKLASFYRVQVLVRTVLQTKVITDRVAGVI
ncbi:hypothetical protein DFH08DRAFT_802161 [Mycena albidolilacea]|uniref:Uncharacterized protein n=1 Tax=Mycena albidolilacea TaxID=1033008 RepID=A0AAD7AGS6_9AGAR|nr:hypothetical protein DFH08DRAFT_802161 [Mycena albidolilacea]